MGVSADDGDLNASDIVWDLEPLLADAELDDLLEQAESAARTLENSYKGKIAEIDASGLAAVMEAVAEIEDASGRAQSYASLKYAENTQEESRGALLARVEEASARIATHLLFIEIEWANLDEEYADEMLADPVLSFCAHYLKNVRRYREHLLSEPEEKILKEKSVSGRTAWVRLFDELTSAIEIRLPDEVPGGGEKAGIARGLSLLQHPERAVRAAAASAVSSGLLPGLKTRAYVFNTLLLDKSVDDRLRNYDSWISSRNLANEASDESVEALVSAVVDRYDIPRRWYSLKAGVLGLDKLADFDRMAPVSSDDTEYGWGEALRIVLDAYESFSPEMAAIARRFVDERWVDAPTRPGKCPGAFCAYTVPSHHPYILLNWTSRARDVSTLAHELGHGIHAWLARGQGIFHQSTPLTLAETASVFGETVTNNALLARLEDPRSRFALLAETLEGSIATVFRQVAMNRFEDSVHRHRRESGELTVEEFSRYWETTQAEMLGDSVELTDGYKIWWSYIPHFIGTPGYVYAYAYGQLFALSVYAQYEKEGEEFVPRYIEMLSAGGSDSPEALGKSVGCDLADPGFWKSGLEIVDMQLERAEVAAGTI